MKPTIKGLPLIKSLEVAQQLIVVVLAVGVPLLVLPVVSEFLFIPKHFLVFTGAALGLFCWLAQAVLRKKFLVTVNPLLLPFALLAISLIASAVVNRVPFAEALFGRVGLFFSAFLVFVIASSRPARMKKKLMLALVGTGVVLAAFTILSFTGALAAFEPPAWMLDKSFTLAGNIPTLLVVLVSLIPLALSLLRERKPRPTAEGATAARNPSAMLASAGLVVGVLILVAAAIITSILIFPDLMSKTPRRMPLAPGWEIAVETLKQNLLLGVGPNRYLTAFSLYRPVSVNTTDVWNQRFLEGPNELLQLFTETGILGLMALLFFLWKLVVLARTTVQHGSVNHLPLTSGSLLLVVASLAVLPLNVVTLMLLVLLASLLVLELKEGEQDVVWNARLGIVALKEGIVSVEKTGAFDPFVPSRAVQADEKDRSSNSLLPWIVFVPGTVLSLAILFGVARAFQAELEYKHALDAIVLNDGTGAYNSLIKTIQANPWFDTYHRQYAEVNLRLANSLSSRTNLSDQDRTNVAQLVQQSIREGKVATTLDTADIRNWETLIGIYRALINVAPGAQDFTLVAYSEAIKRDPTNPLLRLELGGIFFGARDWESAIRSYQTAVSLKPNYANGYYNLALAYEQANRLPDAVRSMQVTIQNLEANSPDFQVAQAKLDALVKKAQASNTPQPTPTPEATPSGAQERLTAPNPLPTAAPGTNRVKLGKDEAPPVTPVPSTAPTQ